MGVRPFRGALAARRSERRKRDPVEAETTQAPRLREISRILRSASASMGPTTTARFARTTPCFSEAMEASVLPRYSSWSEIDAHDGGDEGEATLVASSQPSPGPLRGRRYPPHAPGNGEGGRGQGSREVVRMRFDRAPAGGALGGVPHGENERSKSALPMFLPRP